MLKNLIAKWRSENPTFTTILIEQHDDLLFPVDIVERELDEYEKALYNAVIKYYMFSDIGLDSDYEFILRFNTYWDMKVLEYKQMLKLAIEQQYGNVHRVTNGSDVKTGTDTFGKGTVSTSEQNTSNTGDKASRQNPTEQLTVSGTNSVTVRDTGSDTTQYDNTLTVKRTEDTLQATPDLIRSVLQNRTILESWVGEFYKLFVEVL